ncbi:Oidioi.mRNA.OKI2018_I69.chr2.g4879.t1.cds [Oikopleura dioica]|uniref:Oidioi.mRNA.OKI2018_I69.chr2.g4879.t1.cds n=1 Tax=Oikopleura dioica TaxID=34765 RepID=A0ABN7SYT1_OIKDI|nr:Oidioi.mRNA.OKI2018_I69.chr2.g4879.t1.cds [Oikopleura dioica]
METDKANSAEGKKVCGYYLSRGKARSADVLLMPYNYILEKKIRTNSKIETAQKIIIIDEAHNVEAVCEESSSHNLTRRIISMARDELGEAKIKFDKEKESIDIITTPRKIETIINGMKKLELVYAQKYNEYGKQEGKNFDISELINDAERNGLMRNTNEIWKNLTKNVSAYFASSQRKTHLSGKNFELFAYMMEELISIRNEKRHHDYRARLCKDNNDRFGYNLNIWCFNAKYAIKDLSEEGAIYNLILTSGTLAPMQTYVDVLGLDESGKKTIQFQNQHIIKSEQLLAVTITGYEKTEFRNIYKNRNNDDMFLKYAKIISKIKEVAPGGCLIFHPTYKLMRKSLNIWGINDYSATFKNMFKVPVFVEPENKEETIRVIENYERELEHDEKQGAILNGVCRGKLSEGIDFKDSRARVVIVTGIPYPPVEEPRIKEKMDYLDKRIKTKSGELSGREWYKQGKSLKL